MTVEIDADQLVVGDVIESHDDLEHRVAAVRLVVDDDPLAVEITVEKSTTERYAARFKADDGVRVLTS